MYQTLELLMTHAWLVQPLHLQREAYSEISVSTQHLATYRVA